MNAWYLQHGDVMALDKICVVLERGEERFLDTRKNRTYTRRVHS